MDLEITPGANRKAAQVNKGLLLLFWTKKKKVENMKKAPCLSLHKQ